MVRPARFHPNPQTRADNAFQRQPDENAAAVVALERFCAHFNFELLAFDSADASGRPIYHTNVLMCVATEFALVGLDCLPAAQPSVKASSNTE
jgi:hypothetical protein